jgi:hypothetical protein
MGPTTGTRREFGMTQPSCSKPMFVPNAMGRHDSACGACT